MMKIRIVQIGLAYSSIVFTLYSLTLVCIVLSLSLAVLDENSLDCFRALFVFPP